MAKVTRIAFSKNLAPGKYNRLSEIAKRLGRVRVEVWQRYGSIQGVRLTHRCIRDSWLAEDREFDVPARLWKETLRDTFADIQAYKEAAKMKVRKAIAKRTNDEEERKRLFALLKHDRWPEDNFLCRQMRKHFKHGQTGVDNQIILDTGCYTTFEHNGQAWVKVMSLERGQRIAISLNTNVQPTGTLRLILRSERVEVHYAVDETEACSTKPCGGQVVGIDKGYTEVFTDSGGEEHGQGFGDLLRQESDYLKTKYQQRNKLSAIAEVKPHKRENIERNNLGRKKLDERKRKHTANVRDTVFKAVHSVVDKAKIIVVEDLTAPMNGQSYGKNQNRRLAEWVKGTMAEAIDVVSQRRGAALYIVNAAYTSQTDSRYGILLGKRKGDLFYCFDGEVLAADHNAAQNIKARLNDNEIQLFTPYKDVRNILLGRTEQFIKTVGTAQPGLQLQASAAAGH